MNNEYKQLLQKKEFASLKDSPRVILKWATGCGKSKMALDLIKYNAQKYDNPHILFLVAERAHIQNWKDEFKKWGFDYIPEIKCYASLHKVERNSYDFLVLDEAHHAFTEKRLENLKKVSSEYVYLLSATLSVAKEEEVKELYGSFNISSVTLKDAIENDILPDPKVYVIDMFLDDDYANQEIKINNPSSDAPIVDWYSRNKYIYSKQPCIIKCTEKQKYLYLTNTMEYWKERYYLSKNMFHRNKWVGLGSERKRFLGELKTEALRRLIAKIRGKRYVCFCATVRQATTIGRNTIASTKTQRHNQGIIDSFNNKKIHSIYAVGMITEGMNLKDIQVGIITQLDGKERLFIQKFGRSLRAEDPVSFIFCMKDTQDEKYLKNAFENIDEKFIQHININQIKGIRL